MTRGEDRSDNAAAIQDTPRPAGFASGRAYPCLLIPGAASPPSRGARRAGGNGSGRAALRPACAGRRICPSRGLGRPQPAAHSRGNVARKIHEDPNHRDRCPGDAGRRLGRGPVSERLHDAGAADCRQDIAFARTVKARQRKRQSRSRRTKSRSAPEPAKPVPPAQPEASVQRRLKTSQTADGELQQPQPAKPAENPLAGRGNPEAAGNRQRNRKQRRAAPAGRKPGRCQARASAGAG